MNDQGIAESDSTLVPDLFHSPVFCAGLLLNIFKLLKERYYHSILKATKEE